MKQDVANDLEVTKRNAGEFPTSTLRRPPIANVDVPVALGQVLTAEPLQGPNNACTGFAEVSLGGLVCHRLFQPRINPKMSRSAERQRGIQGVAKTRRRPILMVVDDVAAKAEELEIRDLAVRTAVLVQAQQELSHSHRGRLESWYMLCTPLLYS